MKKIIVLGGTGFIGTHLCEKLVREGWKVTVPTRRAINAKAVMHLPGLTVQQLDVHDEAALTQAAAGHDALVNLVAILHGTQAAFEHAHVALPQKIVHACLAAGVGQVVHVSALGADSLQPTLAPSMYLRSKGELQDALKALEFEQLSIFQPSMILTPTNRYGWLQGLTLAVWPRLNPLLQGAWQAYRGVKVSTLGAAIARNVRGKGKGVELLSWPDFQVLADQPE